MKSFDPLRRLVVYTFRDPHDEEELHISMAQRKEGGTAMASDEDGAES